MTTPAPTRTPTLVPLPMTAAEAAARMDTAGRLETMIPVERHELPLPGEGDHETLTRFHRYALGALGAPLAATWETMPGGPDGITLVRYTTTIHPHLPQRTR